MQYLKLLKTKYSQEMPLTLPMVGMTSLAHQHFAVVTWHNGNNNLYNLRTCGITEVETTPSSDKATMPVSLLTLPYELREQILTTLLSHKLNIWLQNPIEDRAIYTSPITQVCKPLQEEAIRVFYQVNAFTWTIDPEEVSSDSSTSLIWSMYIAKNRF
jgi:hypothetical protein